MRGDHRQNEPLDRGGYFSTRRGGFVTARLEISGTHDEGWCAFIIKGCCFGSPVVRAFRDRWYFLRRGGVWV